jgi:hypothetical protein
VTDRIALYLGLFLAVLIGADLLLNGGGVLLYLAKKFIALMDWVEFWR